MFVYTRRRCYKEHNFIYIKLHNASRCNTRDPSELGTMVWWHKMWFGEIEIPFWSEQMEAKWLIWDQVIIILKYPMTNTVMWIYYIHVLSERTQRAPNRTTPPTSIRNSLLPSVGSTTIFDISFIYCDTSSMMFRFHSS